MLRQFKLAAHNKKFLVNAGVILGLSFAYSLHSSARVTGARIKQLYTLASCHDPHKIRMEMGRIYVDAGEFSKAIDCFSSALPKTWSKPNQDLLWEWENLDREDSFDSNMHVGFGDVFESLHWMRQAEMEYKRALSLAPDDKRIGQRLIRIQAELGWEPVNQPVYQALEAELASKWQPPNHKGCFVTRCLVSTNNGLESITVIGTSGSSAQDESVVKVLKSLRYNDFPIFKMAGVYDFGCMSDDEKKTIAFSPSIVECDVVDVTPSQQVVFQLQDALHWVDKQTGALRL